ncbi:MAG TPA: porin [Rhizomicrobium sp.]|nr:porin [Rhizomicrobium sp.]
MAFRSIAPAGMALAGVAILAAPHADAATKGGVDDLRLKVLEQELHDVQQQLSQIRNVRPDDDAFNTLSDLKRSTSAQYDDLNGRLERLPRTGIENGRLTVASADGAFSLSLRSLIQFDYGYFSQGRGPAGVDLNSGSNFRRAQFGLAGTAWKDWSYNFTYDFGGNGIEKNGYIYSAYIEYNGLKPFGARIGAFAPPAGIEDATGSADLIFPERPAVTDIARNIAGSPGREGISLFAQGDDYLVSVAYTGKKATDAATFDAQEAVVGRASWLAVKSSDFNWLVDANLSHVFKLADTVPGPNSPTAFSFSNGPELAVDSTRTVNTGAIDAKAVTEWGLETAANYGPLYAQAGYFHFDVTRRTALPDPDFSGWYALAAWSLTGESRRYDAATASFRGLKPAHSLGTDGGFGAFEMVARYSRIDLDYQPSLQPAAGGITGGVQDVWAIGLNWYPTGGLRFALDYDNIQVNHITAPASDISAGAIALRSQISF